MTIKHLIGTRTGKAVLSLLVLALLALTLATTVFSNASFTDATSGSHTFIAGQLWHDNSKTWDGATLLLNATGMRPGGDAKTDTVTITSHGDGPGTYYFSPASLVDTPLPTGSTSPGLSTVLVLTITDTTTSTELYSGLVSTFTESTGTVIQAETSHVIQVSLQWPAASVDSTLQADQMELTLQITGISQ